MKVEELRSGSGIRPLKYPLRETPHATIETNRTCNIRCRLCYTLERSSMKTLAEIKGEIELALKKRNLDTITLLGGEPTLHPHLPDVVELNFPLLGGIVRVGNKSEILKIAYVGIGTMAANLVIGTLIHARERAAGLWLLAAGGIVQAVLFTAAVIAIERA